MRLLDLGAPQRNDPGENHVVGVFRELGGEGGRATGAPCSGDPAQALVDSGVSLVIFICFHLAAADGVGLGATDYKRAASSTSMDR